MSIRKADWLTFLNDTNKTQMKFICFFCALLLTFLTGCKKDEPITQPDEFGIQGFQLLTDLTGHWVGTNETAFGNFDWFAFDFRPISASHVHSIYEGGSTQNIITSVFVADYLGEQKVMARNGGWLGGQYRATYFVLDKAEESNGVKLYRLVDAVGGENRSYMEFKFENGEIKFDAYKDNSGSLDEPIHHMGFTGTNFNPSYADDAIELFDYPQAVSEVNLENKFVNLQDPDSALFLEESDDPFPKSAHGHVSDLKINFTKDASIATTKMLLYLSSEPIINQNGTVDLDVVNNKVVRTIDVQPSEVEYTTTYLHPDKYYITAFTDLDGNFYPSSGDVGNVSLEVVVGAESFVEVGVLVDLVVL